MSDPRLQSMVDRARSDELLALAARLEREEPSRALDAEIAKATGWKNVEAATDWGRTDFVGDAPDGDSFQCWLPHWTSSLDSAVTLMPEGWRLDVLAQYPSGFWEARLAAERWLVAHSFDSKTEVGARCAVALRARAALPPPPEGQ